MILQRRIQFPSVGENIRLVEDLVLDMHEELHFSESILDRLMISMTEAVNNAIHHGNDGDSHKLVIVECRCYEDHLEITVDDEGYGFSPDEVPNPLDNENLMKEGGRGLLIIRSMMDSIHFERTPGGGMRLHLLLRY